MGLYPMVSFLNFWFRLFLVGCCWLVYCRPGLSQPRPGPALTGTDPEQLGTTHDFTLTLEAFRYATYQDLMQQANQATATAIATTFATHPDLDILTVHVLAAHNGIVIPMLRTRVSRADWRLQPVVDHWSQAMGLSAPRLLGLGTPGQLTPSGAASPEDSPPLSSPVPRGRSSRIRRLLLRN